MQAVARFAFSAALMATFVMAVVPHPPSLPGNPGDKLQHMVVFATLAVLGTLGWPRRHFLLLFIGLLLFGVLIEAAQAIPALHRNSELMDIVADSVGALLAGLVTRSVLRWRSN